MEYDINRPWLTLDPWQKEYIFDENPSKDNFLLTGRQVGKTTGMSLRAVELCIHHFKEGEFVLINSITEKQAYHMLAKAQTYAESKYYSKISRGKEDKPTKHRLMFKNGTGILCYAAGETGEGLRGFTIKKLMADEGSRMSEEYFIAVLPMLSVIKGSMDIASTPFGTKHKDGSEKFFYKCSKDKKFKKYYISAEDCPRHTEEFLEEMKKKLSKLAYAQEFLAEFTDKFNQLFSKELLKEILILKRKMPNKEETHYLGVDVAGYGKDESAFAEFAKLSNKIIEQREQILEKHNLTTETTRRIRNLDIIFNNKRIGVDDGGMGFGVYSECLDDDRLKRKTDALNNASRETTHDGTKSKKLLKEEMYLNLLSLMENKQVFLLDDDDIEASLSSVQYDEDGKIFASYNHPIESIIRGVWQASKDKSLNMFVYTY